MFLTKMVNDLFAKINNSSQRQLNGKSQQNPSRSADSNYKTCKKSSKSKKSHTKRYCNGEETDQMFAGSAKKEIYFSEHSKTRNNTVTSTKVKSASWKRSDKYVAPFNGLANKKHNSLRKKSPSWLIFSNSKAKNTDLNNQDNDRESASACRPGTLYSDVLFGAGCSNLAKIKNSATPRFSSSSSANASQIKLSNALLTFNGNQENETSDESEVEGNKHFFPALQETKSKFHSPASKIINDNLEKSTCSEDNSHFVNSPTMAFTKDGTYEEADVVILPNLKEVASATKGNENFLTSSISNIPKWNFMSDEVGSSDAFPKFVCQFDDENYLRAEKMALLGLKLALGNSSPQIK